jgi:hypothetical protein
MMFIQNRRFYAKAGEGSGGDGQGKTAEEQAAEQAALDAANLKALENKPAPKPDPKDPNTELLARLDRIEAENKELRGLVKTSKPAPKPEAEGVDMGTLLFTDPEKALGILKSDIRKELTTAYQGERNVEKFFNDFYKAHKDLDSEEDDWLVKATLNQHPELYDLPVKQARKQLGELVRDRMLGFAKRASNAPKPPALEGGDNNPAPKGKQDNDGDEKPKSLSQLTQERKAARLKR